MLLVLWKRQDSESVAEALACISDVTMPRAFVAQRVMAEEEQVGLKQYNSW